VAKSVACAATFPAFQNLWGFSIGNITNLTSPILGTETYGENVLASGTVRGRVGYALGSWLFTRPVDLPGLTISKD
jgi:high affinity Mn2+ porin